MYTDVPHWGLSQSNRSVLLCFLSFSSVIHPISFILISLSLPCIIQCLPVSQSLDLIGEAVFFFYIYLGISDSSFYSHKSFVFFGKVSDTLLCLWNKQEGHQGSQLQASEIRERLHECWWREGRGEEGDAYRHIKHPHMIKYVEYLTGWAAAC